MTTLASTHYELDASTVERPTGINDALKEGLVTWAFDLHHHHHHHRDICNAPITVKK